MSREKFDSLDQAIAEARARGAQILAGGGLGTVSGFRDYTPGERVQARIELSGPGLMRGAEGGIDVMGDGTVVAYTGSIRKRPIEANSVDQALERLGRALA